MECSNENAPAGTKTNWKEMQKSVNYTVDSPCLPEKKKEKATTPQGKTKKIKIAS